MVGEARKNYLTSKREETKTSGNIIITIDTTDTISNNGFRRTSEGRGTRGTF